MSGLPVLERLAACLSRLPGVGRKSAERIAISLARDPDGLARDLCGALQDVQARLRGCPKCGCLTPVDVVPCRLCTSPGREARLLCVVEEPGDVTMIERSGGFRGRYHVLMGKLSPPRGDAPRDLRIDTLLKRIREEGFEEVVLALSTDVEGDATTSYLSDLLKNRKVRVTRLAYGLPAGSGIAYSDAVTLARALAGRQPV